MINKDRQVWNFLEEGDFISLSETWIEEKSVSYIEKKCSKEFWWRFFPANREKKRGRAKGGFLIGVKKYWMNEEDIEIERVEENLILTKLQTKEGKLNIWSVYNAGQMEKYWEIWEEVDYTKENNLIIGGDFNIRIGNEGRIIGEEGDEEENQRIRESKNKAISNGGRKMIERIGKKGWIIIANGNINGDEEGEFTFTGARGSTVIDYVILNEKAKEKVRNFRVEDRIESDHAPLSLMISTSEEEKRQGKGSENKDKIKEEKYIFPWSEESVKMYKAQTEE